MPRAEISWTRVNEEGVKTQAYARHFGNRWIFYQRVKRFDDWVENRDPSLEDLLQVLDGVRRRIGRRLVEPEEEARVLKRIRERYPEAQIPG